jgi:predicted Zn-dependent protease
MGHKEAPLRVAAVTILAVSLAVAAAWAGDKKKDDPGQIGNRDVGKGLNFYSIEKEMALGRQLAQEVRRQARLVEDPIITEYVNRLGQNLVRNSDAKVPFTFQVIEDAVMNAFALPGGYIFVNTGLIEAADEEDELAGAMAHEIAHVAARHMTRKMTKSQLADLLSVPPSILLGGLGGYGVRQGLGAGVPMMFLKFSRADETEADYLGVQYLYAAGYDPNGAISMFEKLESLRQKKPGAIAQIFSTHPMDSSRIEKTQQEIARILPSKPEYIVTTSEFRGIRERLLALELRPVRQDDARPNLRVKPGSGTPSEPQDDSGGRPTVKRRDLAR